MAMESPSATRSLSLALGLKITRYRKRERFLIAGRFLIADVWKSAGNEERERERERERVCVCV